MNRLRAGAIITIPSAGRRRLDGSPPKRPRSSTCRPPIGAPIAIASRRQRPRPEGDRRPCGGGQDRHRGRGKDARRASRPRPASRFARSGPGQGRRRRRRGSRRARQGAARSAIAHRRAREDAEGPAARRRAARTRPERSCRRRPTPPRARRPPPAAAAPAPHRRSPKPLKRPRPQPRRPSLRQGRAAESGSARSRRACPSRRTAQGVAKVAKTPNRRRRWSNRRRPPRPPKARAPKAPAKAPARVLRRSPRQHAVVGDRRRCARRAGRHRRTRRRAPPQDDQVRGQHHLGHRHQDQHGVRLDRRRRRQHRRQFARERFQPRGPRQHRHRRSRSDRRSRGVPRLRPRRAGRGNSQGRAEEGSAAPGDLPQAARDPRAAQQAVGVRDRRRRALFGVAAARAKSGRRRWRSAASSIPTIRCSPKAAPRRRPRPRQAASRPPQPRRRCTRNPSCATKCHGARDPAYRRTWPRTSAIPAAGSTSSSTRKSRSRRHRAAKPKSPIDILAGAESALEKTAKSASATAMSALETAGDKAKVAAAGGAAALGRMGEGMVDTTRPAPPVHDMDFTLDASERPAPVRPAAPRPEPALAVAAVATGAAPSLARPQAAIELDKLDLSFDPDKRDVRGSDAVGARRPVARRRDQARPRQGVSGDGRRRRRARDPAGSAARGRRPAEIGSTGAAVEARHKPQRIASRRRSEIRRLFFWCGVTGVERGSPFHAHRTRPRVRRARRSPAGSRRPTGAACRMRSSARCRPIADARSRNDRGRSHRHRRARDAAGRPFRDRGASRPGTPGCAASTPISRAPSPCNGRSRCRTSSMRDSRRLPGITRICCVTARDAPGAPRRARGLVPSPARRRRDARRRARRSPARMTSPRSAPPSARRNRR